jgi:hypothetical protein
MRWIGCAMLVIACDGGTVADAGERFDAGGRSDAGAFDAGPDAGPPPAPTGCAAFPDPSGPTIAVDPSMADDLPSIVAGAAAGTTILLADGTYRSTRAGEEARRLTFRTPNVTLRSASGDAAAVILDGEYMTNEIAYVVASDVTIAEITITHAVDHLVHVTSESAAPVTGVRLFGVRLIDGGEQFVKVNPGESDGWIDRGIIECSFFQMTDDGRTHVERASGGCYTGGIDAHAAQGWIVRDNRLEDIYCAGEGLAEHAIHFWRNARDTLVENNTIIDCARGIGFGLDDTMVRRVYPDDPHPGAGPLAHIDGVIRNNVIWSETEWYDTGIEIAYARAPLVLHNTVLHTASATRAFSSIDHRFDPTVVTIANNLTTRISDRGGVATLTTNVTDTPLGSVDATFHLTAGASIAIDQGTVFPDSGRDIDGDPHDNGPPDIGADER